MRVISRLRRLARTWDYLLSPRADRPRSWLGLESLEGREVPSAAYYPLANGPFTQNWSDTGMITSNDDWSGVPSIIGYTGAGLTSGTGVDPQTLTADVASPVDVNANQTSPNLFSTAGVAEFHLIDPVVALQGGGSAKAPHLVLHLDTTGVGDVALSFTLRDLDGSTDNALSQVAVQYRAGDTGSWQNVTGGYVADATGGPSQNALVTPVSVTIPAVSGGLLQVRIMTTDSSGTDEWIGVDDIAATAEILKLNSGTGFRGVFDVPSAVSADSSDQVVLSAAAGTNIALIPNPAISPGEQYQLDIVIGDGQITFATLAGVQLTTTSPSSVRLVGTVSALNAALANSLYTAAVNPNGVEQDTIQLRLSGLGERINQTGTSLGTENYVWFATVAVKREKPPGPAPTPGQTQTLQGAGDYAIPRNSFVGITDKTVNGDSTWLWLAKPSSATQESGISSWDDLISKMEADKPAGGYSALVLSGHGYGGGVAATGSALHGDTLTQAQASKLKAILKDGAPVILFACQQGKNGGCQILADKLGHPVIANKGDVNLGNSGDGDWVRFNPQ